MSWLLGKNKTEQSPEDQELLRKRKEALNRPNTKAEEAYLKKLEEQRIKNAEAKAIEDANQLANQKPFYQKVMGMGTALLRDLGDVAANTNPNALINFDEEKPKRTNPKRRKNRWE